MTKPNKNKTIEIIEDRIKREYRKHKDIEWEHIAACKIYRDINELYGIDNQRKLLINFGEWIHSFSGEPNSGLATKWADMYLSNLQKP
ncbi:unnamed protein product [marine sediment metagenome]|uniref:Uncharacterized protein n=1 Tax=marine sediment metagenome TaxID=412755 RepID=X0YVZ1_9ZZZZ